MTEWTYRGNVVDSIEKMPEATIGFVYLITNTKTGRAYFGKKLSHFSKTSVKTVTLKNGTKRKKKIRTKVPSDWKTYWSSSVELVSDVAALGEENFTREILCYCSNKSSLSYFELQYQMDARVLEHRDKFYNGILNCRIHHAQVRPPL